MLIKYFSLTFPKYLFKIPSMEINIEKIERERERMRIDRKQLAKALGMHYQGLDYIYEKRSTRLETIQKIADFFGLEGKDLLR